MTEEIQLGIFCLLHASFKSAKREMRGKHLQLKIPNTRALRGNKFRKYLHAGLSTLVLNTGV